MANLKTALFAAGCFWGVQDYFDKIPGVVKTVVGYTGGHVADPTYEQVCSHTTGHAEAVKLFFDPTHVSYHQLVEHFFRMHDPTQVNRQGPDIGDNYRSAIFYVDGKQKQTAEQIKQQLDAEKKFEHPIATEITKANTFYQAEAYHQKFVQKNGYGACVVPYVPLPDGDV